MATRGALVFRTWRPLWHFAANSQAYLNQSNPSYFPIPPDTEHFARGPLFARVEAKRRAITAYTWTQGATERIPPAAEQMPLNQYNWPNPQRREPPRQDFQRSFILPLQEVIQPNQYDWPLPPRAALRGRPDWLKYTLPWAQAPPINQTDWPVPKGRPPTLLRTWTDSFKLPLQQVIQPNQYSWPLPPRARPPLVQDWFQSTALLITQPERLPFNQYDWSMPHLRVRNPQDQQQSANPANYPAFILMGQIVW